MLDVFLNVVVNIYGKRDLFIAFPLFFFNTTPTNSKYFETYLLVMMRGGKEPMSADL